MNLDTALSAFVIGLAGATHCMGMCGGFALAFQSQTTDLRRLTPFYHVGRLLSYGVVSALLSFAALSLGGPQLGPILRLVAGLLLVAMGLHTLRLWLGIRHLEALGAMLWRLIEPLARKLLPPQRPTQALLLGSLWGFMPCGLVYGAVAYTSSAVDSPWASALLMIIFGVGTLPAMLGLSLAGQQAQLWLRRDAVRTALGLLLLASGCWTVFKALSPGHVH